MRVLIAFMTNLCHCQKRLPGLSVAIFVNPRAGAGTPACGSFPLLVVLTALVIGSGVNLVLQHPALAQDSQTQGEVGPPPPTTITLRDGNQKKTVRWERFGNDVIVLHTEHGKVFVNGTVLSRVPPAVRRCIEYTLADYGVTESIEDFVRSASQLPLQSRDGTRQRPIRLVLPVGFGVYVSDGSPCVVAVCEVIEPDRQKMFKADQQLVTYYQSVLRDQAKVMAAQEAAFAAQDAAIQLRNINTSVEEVRRSLDRIERR